MVEEGAGEEELRDGVELEPDDLDALEEEEEEEEPEGSVLGEGAVLAVAGSVALVEVW